MRLPCLAIVVVVPLLPPSTLSLHAQQPIRVLRHAPADTVRPGESITISFDRPVVGSAERTPDPKRILRIEPSIDATMQWRDPTTLRVIPTTPLVPGRRYRVTLSDKFTSVDGGRLDSPYRFTLATAGPRLLASIPGFGPTDPPVLAPNGRVRIVYSASVDSAALARVVRLEVAGDGQGCSPRSIPYQLRAQRALKDDDDYNLRYAGGWDLDSAQRSFHRLVELRPTHPLPEGCKGSIVLPSLDPADRLELHYPIRTTAPFRLSRVACVATDCAGDDVQLLFSAPIHRDSLVRYLRLEPNVPFTVEPNGEPANAWVIRLKVAPKATYRVTVASALTDVYTRRLADGATGSITGSDRKPAFGHQLGFITVPRSHPVLRLTHVNVDSVELSIVQIPDSLRARVLDLTQDQDGVGRLIGRLRDTTKHRVALVAALNEERITGIPIPSAVLTRARGSLLAIRAHSIPRLRHALDAPHVRGQSPPIAIEASSDGPSVRTAIVQVTDLMAHAKVSDDGGAVFVTDGATGAPVRGARVTTRGPRDEILAVGETNVAGVATLVAAGPRPQTPEVPVQPWARRGYRVWRGNVRFVEVVHGADRSLTYTGARYWGSTGTTEQLGASMYDVTTVRASVFTDRAIYRPGEKIYVGSILRLGHLSRLRVPDAGDSVRVRVTQFDPSQREPRTVHSAVIRVSAFGTAVDSFSLSRAVALGTYDVAVDAYANGWETAATHSFRLAEYRAPEFQTTVVLDSAVRFLGDTVTATIGGRYYFGAAMNGAIVRWTATTSDAPGSLQIPGLPSRFSIGTGYHGGSPRPAAGNTEEGVDTLDASGRLTLRVPTTVGDFREPALVELNVAIDDLTRQFVSASDAVVMHSSTFYVAARDSSTSGWYWNENVPRRFDVIAVRPDGRRVPNVAVTIAAVRHHMRFVPGNTEGESPSARWTADTVARESIVTGDSLVSYSFTPRASGWHELVFLATDERGRTLRTTLGSYVVGREWTPWMGHPLRLAMAVDTSDVAPGDTLVVRFVSPFRRAEAWVSVEREHVLAHRRLSVGTGESIVRIPVTEDFIPGAQVSVLLVDSGAVATKDSLHHRIRGGYAAVSVRPAIKTLAVDVQPDRSRYYPGDSARVTVSVRDHRSAGARASVMLWAVDEAVLALEAYERPDPVAAIYADRGTALRLSTTMTTLASLGRFLAPPGWVNLRSRVALSAMSLSEVVMTSTATAEALVNNGSVLRADFRSTAFFIGSLLTDTTGRATAVLRLPDNVTTYRVMAVAVGMGDVYGSGESSIMLTKPLIARPALPRFLRTGDALFAGSVINNTTRETTAARITATGAGVVRLGDTTIVRSVAAGAGSEVRFNWRASGTPGDSAAFRFDLSNGAHRDAVQVTLPMRPPYAPRAHAVTGVTRGQSIVRLMLPRDIDPARSRLTLRVGTTPIPIVQAAFAQAEVYPYYCTEQLTSAGQVILAMLRLQRAGLVDPRVAPDSMTLRARLQFVADELTRRQSGTGGVGYWTSGSWTHRWLTTYAGTLLIDARDAGIRVDSMTILGISEFVGFDRDRDSIVVEPTFGTRAERARIVADALGHDIAALHFLRRAGVPDTTRENQLVAMSTRMTWEDRVWLAELLAGRADPTPARAQLARVWQDVEMIGVRVDIPDSLLQTLGFRSRVRPVARLLDATVAIDPDHPRIAPLIERIVHQGRADQDRMWNTQDYAILARTFANLAVARRSTGPPAMISVRSARQGASDRVLINASAAKQAESTISLDGLLERDGDWMALPLRVESDGATAFYVVTVDEVPLAPPKKPDARGMIVERWFERFDNGRPVTEATEGELVRGRLRITVPSDREFVAVEDLLPAGLEVVDLSLRTTSLGPFESEMTREAVEQGDRANSSISTLYGSWLGGWWSPWEHEEKRDDRVVYFARKLWKGTYTASYVARATTVGTFVRPPAHAEEMYNPSVGGRSDGSIFRVLPKK